MEENTLSEHGALHNRRTGQILLEPLEYAGAAEFYPRYIPEGRVAAYAIWGGMPSYLAEIDPDAPLWENVRESILRPGARLADDAQWLRFTDLRSDASRFLDSSRCYPAWLRTCWGQLRLTLRQCDGLW